MSEVPFDVPRKSAESVFLCEGSRVPYTDQRPPPTRDVPNPEHPVLAATPCVVSDAARDQLSQAGVGAAGRAAPPKLVGIKEASRGATYLPYVCGVSKVAHQAHWRFSRKRSWIGTVHGAPRDQ